LKVERVCLIVAESKANKSRAKAAKAKNITFTQLAADYITAKEHEWRNPKHRDQWAANCTTFDRQTCEHALAQQLPNKVEAAYERSTMLEKRKALMQAWADRCYDRNPPSK
jgi:hypothetical protein